MYTSEEIKLISSKFINPTLNISFMIEFANYPSILIDLIC